MHEHHLHLENEGKHLAPEENIGVYLKAWLLTFCIVGLEIVGSIISGSFALLADVTHVITDTLVGLAPLSVEYLKKKTGFSPRHIEQTGGLLASILLLVIGWHIVGEAHERVLGGSEHAVSGGLLALFAGVAALVNYSQHRLLSRVSPMHRHAAHSGFHFHILTDLVKNILLPIMGIAILFGVSEKIDAYAAYAIGILILVRSLILFFESIAGKRLVQDWLDKALHFIAR